MIVDSKQQMLDLPDLLQAAVEETPTSEPLDIVLAAFYKEIQMPDVTLYKYGNTIFIVHQADDQPGTGIFRALNADTAQNFLQSSYQWVQDAYADGFWLLITEFEDASLLHIFDIISRNPPNPDMGFTADELEEGGFRVTLTLGTPPADADIGMEPSMRQPQMSEPQMPAMGMLNRLGGQ